MQLWGWFMQVPRAKFSADLVHMGSEKETKRKTISKVSGSSQVSSKCNSGRDGS